MILLSRSVRVVLYVPTAPADLRGLTRRLPHLMIGQVSGANVASPYRVGWPTYALDAATPGGEADRRCL